MRNDIRGHVPSTSVQVSYCFVCGDDLTGALMVCPDCGATHHEHCWEYNEGCGVHHCRDGTLPPPPVLQSRPAFRMAAAMTGAAFIAAATVGATLLSLEQVRVSRVKPRVSVVRTVTSATDPADHLCSRKARRSVIYYGGNPSVVTYGNLGNAYARNGEYDLAMACYRKVLELDPDFAFGHFNLGNLHAKRGELAAARRAYERALEVDPSLTEARCNLGVVWQRMGEPNRALQAYREALAHDARYAGTYYSRLGEVRYEEGRRDEAKRAFAEAIRVDPCLAVPKNNLAYLYAEEGINLDEAMVLVDEALLAEPENAAFLDTKGWIYFKLGDYVRAEEFLEKAHELLPGDSEIRDHLVQTWARLLG